MSTKLTSKSRLRAATALTTAALAVAVSAPSLAPAPAVAAAMRCMEEGDQAVRNFNCERHVRVAKKKRIYIPPPPDDDQPPTLYSLTDPGGGEGGDSDSGSSSSGTTGATASDCRLKRALYPLTRLANGIGLYCFKYAWSDTQMIGVIAQEVLQHVPDAVRRGAGGYYRVDYARLGLTMTTYAPWKARLLAYMKPLPAS